MQYTLTFRFASGKAGAREEAANPARELSPRFLAHLLQFAVTFH